MCLRKNITVVFLETEQGHWHI